MAVFKAPDEVIRQVQSQKAEKDFEVLEENWETVRFFLKLQTQWKISDGAFFGLDYTAVQALFTIHKTDDPVSIFEGLQIMELAALGALNKRKD